MKQSMRLLVTGGAGFIGANFVHYWLAHYPGDRVVVLDALTYAGSRANLSPLVESAAFRFVHGDICDRPLVERLLNEEAIDVVVNLAAESHVDRSIAAPDAFVRTNVIGTQTLLTAALHVWGDRQDVRFHQVSTDEVYGSLGPHDAAFTEQHPFAPNSPYAASKAAADHLVRAFHRTYGLPVTTSHCSNNYGPLQFPEKLIPRMILNALRGEVLPLYGDGQQVRDWLHVDDHCRGIEHVLVRGAVGERYNLGGNNERQNRELVERLCAGIDARFAASPSLRSRFPRCPAARGEPTSRLMRFVADRPGHDRRYALDARRASRELGFLPETDFDAGFEATVDWYLAHAEQSPAQVA